jgi:hypothetical protein
VKVSEVVLHNKRNCVEGDESGEYWIRNKL